MRSKSIEVFHITPKGNLWEVRHTLSGSIQPFKTRGEAEIYAHDEARRTRPCEIVVFGRDGREVSREVIG
jgi:hypothetical protein